METKCHFKVLNLDLLLPVGGCSNPFKMLLLLTLLHFFNRFANVSYWVATLVVAAGDLGAREQVLSKLIELADVLSDKLGNLVSFMAVMEGLALPQVKYFCGLVFSGLPVLLSNEE